MSTIVNKGRNFTVITLSLNSTTDVALDIQSGYTSAAESPAPANNYVPTQVGNVSSVAIQCRTAVDIQLRTTNGNTNFFTIKSGTIFNLDISPTALGAGQIQPFFLRSGTGS